MCLVGLLVFPGFEPLDLFGPVEAFSIARLPDESEAFRLVNVAASREPVAMSGGLKVLPDYTFADCPQVEILLVPGGMGTRKLVDDAATLAFIRRQSEGAEVVASVCTGAALLGRAGLLDGLPATTNRRAFEWVQSVAPGARWDQTVRWVDNGKVITSAGVSAGTDMALYLVARLLGQEVAEAAALRMEYRWDSDPTDPPV